MNHRDQFGVNRSHLEFGVSQTWKPPGSHHLESHLEKPPGRHLEATRKPPGSYLEAIWKPPGSHLEDFIEIGDVSISQSPQKRDISWEGLMVCCNDGPFAE